MHVIAGMFVKANITPSRNSSCPIPWHLSQRPSFAASVAIQSNAKQAMSAHHESDTADHITIAPQPRLVKDLQARQRSIIALLKTRAKKYGTHLHHPTNRPIKSQPTTQQPMASCTSPTKHSINRPTNQPTNLPTGQSKLNLHYQSQSKVVFMFYLADSTLHHPTKNYSTKNKSTIQRPMKSAFFLSHRQNTPTNKRCPPP